MFFTKIKAMIAFCFDLIAQNNWWEEADVELIKRSAKKMVEIADVQRWQTILIPRPGCGNGRLKYSDVEPVIAEILDDRFFIVTH
jgi:hypothetical protein